MTGEEKTTWKVERLVDTLPLLSLLTVRVGRKERRRDGRMKVEDVVKDVNGATSRNLQPT